MKKFIMGFVVGAIASGFTTFVITKKETEKRTINELREELLESCMREARKEFEDSEPVTLEIKDVIEEDEINDLPFDNPNEDKPPIDLSEYVKNYKEYYKVESDDDEVAATEEEDDDEFDAELYADNFDINELLARGEELSETEPYQYLDYEEFSRSEWDEVYDKELLTFHIPNECMVEDNGNVLDPVDVIDMLGPDFEGVLADHGKVFVRNHRQQTTYEVYTTDLSYEEVY